MYSYILRRDYGFAPNPFYGYCTLCTCKPEIRRKADIGDWVIATGSQSSYRMAGRVIYAMRVDQVLTFDEYWSDRRFFCKHPVLAGSLKQIYGDNIYHKEKGKWIQSDSHHSYSNGSQNPHNITHDTRVNRVLTSQKFVFFGREAPKIPDNFRKFGVLQEDICWKTQGHKVVSQDLAEAFIEWLEESGKWGIQGLPKEFEKAVIAK